MNDIDLTMLARAAYKAILKTVEENAGAQKDPQTAKEVVPMSAQK